MNDRPVILYLDNSFTFGGAINSLMYMLRAQDRRKYEPILVTGQPEEYLARHFGNITWYKVNPKLPWIHNKRYNRIASLPLFRNRAALKVLNVARFLFWFLFHTLPEAFLYYRIGKKHRVRLVHLNNMLGSQFAGIIAARILGVPCVAHLRDFESSNVLNRFFAGFVHHHIAISSSICENLLELAVPREKITIVYDAIDMDEFNDAVDHQYIREEFGLRDGQKTFGVFGRIMFWKGIKEFVIAADRVFKDLPDARAFVVGSPSDGAQEYLDEVRGIVRKLGLEDRVVFTGFRKDVPALMKTMDVIVHASISPEPFGMVIIEGMAMGKPVIATRAGGPLDIVLEEETGYLVHIRNVEAMASRIVQLLQDETLSRTMGEKGRARVFQVFCKERYARQVEDVYARLLMGHVPTLWEKVKGCIPREVKRRVRLFVMNCMDSVRYLIGSGPAAKASGARHVVFVCKGNICRSAYAEHVLRQRLGSDAMVVESCGLDVDQGGAPPPEAVAAAGRRGVDISAHVPKKIAACHVDAADVIFAMEYGQWKRLRRMYPHKRAGILLLRSQAPFPCSLLVNIDDPFGWGPEHFDSCFRLIDASLDAFLRAVRSS